MRVTVLLMLPALGCAAAARVAGPAAHAIGGAARVLAHVSTGIPFGPPAPAQVIVGPAAGVPVPVFWIVVVFALVVGLLVGRADRSTLGKRGAT